MLEKKANEKKNRNNKNGKKKQLLTLWAIIGESDCESE